MRGVIIVQTMEEYKKYLSEQKSEYYTIFPDKAPKVDTAASVQITQALPVNK